MTTAVATSTCLCGFGHTGLRRCLEHHYLWRDAKRLTSVSRILSVWPQDPCSSCGMPMFSDHQGACPVKANIANARQRGIAVDDLFCRWLASDLPGIPVGTREDVKNLLKKLVAWWGKQSFTNAQTQVLLADDDTGGVCDLKMDGVILDIKATYDIAPTHAIQVGGYVALDAAMTGHGPKQAGILHVTERYSEPRVTWLDLRTIGEDWLTCKAMHRLVSRYKKEKE